MQFCPLILFWHVAAINILRGACFNIELKYISCFGVAHCGQYVFQLVLGCPRFVLLNLKEHRNTTVTVYCQRDGLCSLC